MAVMLMAGIAVFSVPTPEFGPAILATPLWALILLHYWTGATRGAWIYWVALGVEAGLLLLTTYAGLILIGLLVVYTLSTAFGRAQVETVGPWIAGVAMTAVLFPYLIWLDLSTGISFARPRNHRRQSAHLGLACRRAAAEPRRHGRC